jgi:hypothetical protein
MMSDRIFVGVYPEGLVYADRAREVAGDYARLAFQPYDTLEPDYARDIPSDVRPSLERLIRGVQARRGERFSRSESQPEHDVILGAPSGSYCLLSRR